MPSEKIILKSASAILIACPECVMLTQKLVFATIGELSQVVLLRNCRVLSVLRPPVFWQFLWDTLDWLLVCMEAAAVYSSCSTAENPASAV